MLESHIYNKRPVYAITYADLCEEFGEEFFSEMPYWTKYPNLSVNKDELVELFDLKYKCREIGYSTPGRFIDRLRLKYLEVASKYDFHLGLYESQRAKLGTPGKTTDRVYHTTGTASNETTSDSTKSAQNSYYDTPKTNLPDPLFNPSNVSVDTGNNKDSATGSTNTTTDETENVTMTSEDTLIALNKIGEEYRNLLFSFIDEFNDLFMRLYIME